MRCTIKGCYNGTEDGNKYCKYHLMKIINRKGKILSYMYPVVGLIIGIGIKKIMNKNK